MLRHFQNRPPHQQGIAWRRPEENHTKTVDRGKTTGKPWENHKTIAKPWENDDSTKKENEDFCMDLKLIYDSYTMLQVGCEHRICSFLTKPPHPKKNMKSSPSRPAGIMFLMGCTCVAISCIHLIPLVSHLLIVNQSTFMEDLSHIHDLHPFFIAKSSTYSWKNQGSPTLIAQKILTGSIS